MKNLNYHLQRRNRIKQYFRLRLGVLQLINFPILNLILIPIIGGAIFIGCNIDDAYRLFHIPNYLLSIYRLSINTLVIFLPTIITITLLNAIGELTARKDESKLYVAFNSTELRNGCPILINKKHIKGQITYREFYSNIPMSSWNEKKEDIADAMNCHFVEKLSYGGDSDGKRIILITAKGRTNSSRGDLYDDEL